LLSGTNDIDLKTTIKRGNALRLDESVQWRWSGSIGSIWGVGRETSRNVIFEVVETTFTEIDRKQRMERGSSKAVEVMVWPKVMGVLGVY